MTRLLLVVFGCAAAFAASPGFSEILFEPNLGQTAKPSLFLTRAQGYTAYLVPDGALLVSPDGEQVRMKFPGSLRGKWEPQNRAAETISYYVGNDPAKWVKAAPQYSRVVWRGAYPGIDIAFYGRGRKLEYDIIVAPQSDPSVVRLRFSRPATVDSEGGIQAGFLRQRPPAIFQDGDRTVTGAFELLKSGDFGLRLAPYDRNAELVVDPVVETFQVMGGEGDDEIKVVTTAFVAGNTTSVAFPGAPGSRRRTRDVFVRGTGTTFFNPGNAPGALFGTLIFGGSDDDEIGGAALGGFGNALAQVAGTTRSRDLPLAVNKYAGGSSDGFVFGIGAFGSAQNPALFSAEYVGGSGEDRIHAMSVFGTNFAIAGSTDSTDVQTVGGMLGAPSTGRNALIGLRSFARTTGWSLAYLGGSSDDTANAIQVVANAVLAVGGETKSADFPFPADGAAPLRGESDGFLAFVSYSVRIPTTVSGVLEFLPATVRTHLVGGDGNDSVRALAWAPLRRTDGTDPNLPNVPASDFGLAVGGATTSSDLPVRNAAQAAFGGGSSDGFAGLWSPDQREFRWLTYVGGSAEDSIDTAAQNWFGDPMFGGSTGSTDIAPVDAVQPKSGGGVDGLFAMYSPSGTLHQLSYWGGTAEDRIFGITALNGRTAGIVGVTKSPDFRPSIRSWDESGGGGEGFFAKIGTHSLSGPEELHLPKDGALTVHWRSNTTIRRLAVTYKSSDPEKVRVYRLGTSLAEATIAAEDGVMIEVLTDSGEVTLTVSAPGHRDKQVRVRLYPGVFTFAASTFPIQVFSRTNAAFAALTYSAFDAAAGRTVGTASLRPGLAPPTVRWSSSDPSVFTVSPTSSTTASIAALAAGEARISLEVDGYRYFEPQPIVYRYSGIRFPPASFLLGKGLYVGVPIPSFGVPALPTQVTVRSGDPSKVLVGNFNSERGESVTVTVQEPLRPSVVAYGLADSGEVPIILTGPDIEGELIFTVNLRPAALRLILHDETLLRAETQPGKVDVGQTRSLGAGFVDELGMSIGDLPVGEPQPSIEFSISDPTIGELAPLTTPSTGLTGLRAGIVRVSARETSGRYALEGSPIEVTITPRAPKLTIPTAVVIGKDLQTSLPIGYLDTSFGFVNRPPEIAVESADPSALLVSSTGRTAGTASTIISPESGSTFTVFLQALKDSGTVPVRFRAPGLPDEIVQVTLLPSAIGVEVASTFAVTPYDVTLQVAAYVVDDKTGQRLTAQAIRPGITGEVKLRAEGAPIRLSADSIRFDPNASQTVYAIYPPKGEESEIIAGPFGSILEAPIASRLRLRRPDTPPPSDLLPPGTAVRHIARPYQASSLNSRDFAAAVSADPSRLLLSEREDSQPAARVPVSSFSPFFLHALDTNGTVDLEIRTSSGETAATTRISLEPLTLNLGNVATSLASGTNVRWTISAGNGGNLLPGTAPIGVSIRSTDERVVRISPERVEFRPGMTSAFLTITAVGPGTSELVAIPDSGTPVFAGLRRRIDVRPADAQVREFLLGRNLQIQTNMTLPGSPAAPTGGLTLTLTSSDPSKLVISQNLLTAGTASTTVTMAAGTAQTPPIFLQALSDEGVVTIRVTASNGVEFTNRVRLSPVSIAFSGSEPLRAAVGSEVPMTLRFQLEGAPAGSFTSYSVQPGAGDGRFRVISSDPTILEAPSGSFMIGQTFTLRARAVGTTTIRAEGSGMWSDYRLRAEVVLPLIETTCERILHVAKDSQLRCDLRTPQGTQVQVRSLQPSLMLVSAMPGLQAAEQANATAATGFTIHGLAARGTAEIELSAQGFTPIRVPVVSKPLGIEAAPQSIRLARGGTALVSVVLSTAETTRPAAIRAGARVTVEASSSDAAVATISIPRIDFNQGETVKSFEVRGVSTGSTTLRFTGPDGSVVLSQPIRISVD